MKNSTLIAMFLLVLIASAGSFAGGYFVGKGDSPATTIAPPPIADGSDKPLDRAEPLQGKPDPTPTPPPVDKPLPKPETDQPDTVAQPAGPGTAPDAASKPDTNASGLTPARPKSAGGVAEGPGEVPIPGVPGARILPGGGEFEEMFNGPKVEVKASISGTVVDPRGVPVAGARVHAEFGESFTSDEGGDSMRLVMRSSSSEGEDGQLIATTDAAGFFSADISRQIPEKASLQLTLTASADGFARSRTSRHNIRNGDNKENIKLAVRGSGNVTGRVVDGNGTGVSGVNVSLRAVGGDSGGIEIEMGDFGGGQYSAVTDGAGEFTIKSVPEGRYRFRLRSMGVRQTSGPTEIDVAEGQDARASADFVVTATASLRATFIDAQGQPAQGWATLVIKDGDKIVKRMQGPVSGKGVFEANDPPAGSLSVEITLWGFKRTSVTAVFTEGQVTDLGTLTMEPDAEGHTGGILIPGDD